MGTCSDYSEERVSNFTSRISEELSIPPATIFFFVKHKIKDVFAVAVVLFLFMCVDTASSYAISLLPVPKNPTPTLNICFKVGDLQIGECPDKKKGTERRNYRRTKLGVRVHIPKSLYENGIYLADRLITRRFKITKTILEWVDIRVLEWIDSHPDLNPDELLELARSYKFVIHDHWGLTCSASSTGLCSGLHEKKYKTIHASIYLHFSTVDIPEIDYIPPHTIMTSKEVAEWAENNYWTTGSRAGKYYWGIIPSDGVGMAVIPYELNHPLGYND